MGRERLESINGLSGVAIAMVLLCHADFSGRWLGGQLNQGVSLFLVLSGSCLSCALLKRRSEGWPDWFSITTFIRSRCRRILPPYYASLLASTGISAVLASSHIRQAPAIVRAPTIPDIAARVFLVQTVTPYRAG